MTARLRSWLGLSGALACAAVMSLASASAQSKGGKDKPAGPPAKADVSKCVEVRAEAIYGAYGYDHHVYLRNGCDKTVRCEVTTSSNPEVTTVTVAVGETQDVVMFRGSPASEVSATAKCAAAGG